MIADMDDDLRYGLQLHAEKGVTINSIARVVLAITDGHFEPRFTWIVELKAPIEGKTWAALRGWHDSTGWYCQSGLTTELYESEEAAWRTLVDWERDEAGR